MEKQRRRNIFSMSRSKLFSKIATIFIIFSAIVFSVNTFYLEDYVTKEFVIKQVSLLQTVADSIKHIPDDELTMKDIESVMKVAEEKGYRIKVLDLKNNLMLSEDSRPLNEEEKESAKKLRELKESHFYPDSKNYKVIEPFRSDQHENIVASTSFRSDNLLFVVANNFDQGKIVIDRTYRTMYEAQFVVMLLGVISTAFLHLSLRKPLDEIGGFSEEMLKGNYGYQAKMFGGDDEFNRIISVLNNLSLKLKNNKEDQDLLISSLSHEIKTPLAIISSYAQILESSDLKDEDKEMIQIILNETEQINKMVKQGIVLHKSKVNEYQFEQINLSLLIENVIGRMDSLSKEKAITVIQDIEPNYYITFSQQLADTIVVNYINNAIKHSPDNSVVYVEFLNGVLTVSNDGKIDENDIERIWDNFYKSDKSRNRKEMFGSGLGLSLVSTVGDRYDMKYGVYNEMDRVNFYFDFEQ